MTTTSAPFGRHTPWIGHPDEQLLAASRHYPQQFAPLFDRHAVDIHHVRTVIRRYRALARLPVPPPVEPDPTDRLDAHRLRAQIAAALAELKPADQDPLLLAWGELSYPGIAAVQNVPAGTVPLSVGLEDSLAVDYVHQVMGGHDRAGERQRSRPIWSRPQTSGRCRLPSAARRSTCRLPST